ncbi:MAG: DnaB-like helicase N-terminal domain-containing protein, partial [Janthinobacterium lividum]
MQLKPAIPMNLMAPSPALKSALDKASNIEAEAAILGAMLIDNRVVPQIAELIEPQDFYEPAHSSIYVRIVALVDAGKAATAITVRPYLDDEETLKAVGGAGAYLAGLTTSPGVVVIAPNYAHQLVDLAKRRALLLHLDALQAATNDFTLTNDQIVEGLDAGLSTVLERRSTTTSYTLAESFSITVAEIEQEAAGLIPRGVASAFLPDFAEIAGDM